MSVWSAKLPSYDHFLGCSHFFVSRCIRHREKKQVFRSLQEREDAVPRIHLRVLWTLFRNVIKFIKTCCTEIAYNKGLLYSVLKHQWVTRLSATLQRCNSYFLTNCYRRLLNTEDSESDKLYNSYYHRR